MSIVETSESTDGDNPSFPQQWATVQEEDTESEELLDLSRQILELTKAVHAATGARNRRH